MRTCDHLGSSELERGNLDAAEVWYERSRELAEQRKDKHQLAVVAQNPGILYQTRAEQSHDPAIRESWLRRAAASVEDSLRQEFQDEVGAAESYGQLGILYRFLGELDQAEEHALQALRIHEQRGLPVLYKTYGVLAAIAQARGDTAAAADWQAKREAKVAELQAQNMPAVPDDVIQTY